LNDALTFISHERLSPELNNYSLNSHAREKVNTTLTLIVVINSTSLPGCSPSHVLVSFQLLLMQEELKRTSTNSLLTVEINPMLSTIFCEHNVQYIN